MHKCIYLLLLAGWALAAPISPAKRTPTPGLYFLGEHIDILDYTNLNSTVFDSESGWIVEFYSSWCGFCQRFAPGWKAFAADVKNWRNVVRVAAINCADEDNFPTCAEYGVSKYPTVKYFPPRSRRAVEVSPGSTEDDHRMALVKVMRNERLPEPNLDPYTGDIPQIFTSGVKYAFLIAQDENDTVGPELILDYRKDKDIIAVKYFYKANNRLSNQLNVDRVPSIYVVEKDDASHPKPLTSYAPDRSGISGSIRRYLQTRKVSLHEEVDEEVSSISTVKPSTYNKEAVEEIKMFGDTVFQVDLENALRYSLKQEIGGSTLISGEKLKALRSYMDLLDKYFPIGAEGKLLLSLIRHYVQSHEQVSGPFIYNVVKEAENKDTFSSPPTWKGCMGSAPWYRGYPCSLWKLFHYLVINSNHPEYALRTMHGYVKEFFGCVECSRHFQEMSAKRELFNVTGSDEAILWLWKAHNEVNGRLAKDQTEDPEFPKVQFPTSDRCKECRNENGTYNEAEVLKYLKDMYEVKSINYLGSDIRKASPDRGIFAGVPRSFNPANMLIFVAFLWILRM